jgi:hypothetical protein
MSSIVNQKKSRRYSIVGFLISKHSSREGKESLKDSDGVWQILLKNLRASPFLKTNGMTLLSQIHVFLDKQYTVKKVIDFPVPSLDVTNQTLPGRE